MVDNDKEDIFPMEVDEINVDSLWLFPSRDKTGKHKNVYHGNFIPQIPNQLLRRYTKEGDIVADIFMGSGTTLFECERLNRHFIGFDINKEIISYVQSAMDQSSPIFFDIHDCDIVNEGLAQKAFQSSLSKVNCEGVDFLICHPPYMDIVKFSDDERDLSTISDLNSFLNKLLKALSNGLAFLNKGKYFAIVIGDLYKNREVLPLGFRVLDAVKNQFDVKLKGIIVKNIEGSRGKLGRNGIWRSRALRSDYFLFKHEYILVFKKEC